MHFSNKIPKLFFISFLRSFYWVRHLNFFLLGFITSKNFSYFLLQKLSSFIRSNLLCDVKDVLFTSYLDKNLFFLGFNFSFLNRANYFFYDRKLNFLLKFTGRVKGRIYFYRQKMLNIINKRFNSEFFLHFLSLMKRRKLIVNSISDIKLWSYIFQLEAIRSFQINKLLFTCDSSNSLNYFLFSELKFDPVKDFVFYRKYSFNLYIRKLHIVFKDILNNFKSYFIDSIMTIDIALYKFTVCFQKKMFLIYENLYYDVFNCRYDFSSSSVLNKKKCLIPPTVWRVLIPKYFIWKKLRVWGFVHSNMDRPISNVKFLFLEDKQIINNFGFIAHEILTWFRCCDNFSVVKFFIEVIKQSCFLTLCRKHNKSKNWAYSVYTPNLFFSKNLNFKSVVFPTKSFVSKLKKKFLLGDSIFSFNERFFLT